MKQEIRDIQRRAGVTPTPWWKKLWLKAEIMRDYIVSGLLVIWILFLLGVYWVLGKEPK